MKNWLRWRFRNWLGVSVLEKKNGELNREVARLRSQLHDLASIGVDVHFKGEPHMILIYSRLGGGQIREISAHFDNLADLMKAVRDIGDRYGARKENVFIDSPSPRMSEECLRRYW